MAFLDVRRLAAVDMHGSHGSDRRQRVAREEFLVGAIACLAWAWRRWCSATGGAGCWAPGWCLAEISHLGAIATAVYQLVRKFTCHQPGCWRIGNHPAAGGQFMLYYRHHPDYQGWRPGAELIYRLHREHNERQALMHTRMREIHEQLHARSDGVSGVRVAGQDRVRTGSDAAAHRTAEN